MQEKVPPKWTVYEGHTQDTLRTAWEEPDTTIPPDAGFLVAPRILLEGTRSLGALGEAGFAGFGWCQPGA